MRSVNQADNLLHHVASVLMKQSDQVLQEQLGIGYAQFKILQLLADKPSLRQLDIAVTLGQTEASISRQVKLLISDGLLQVSRNKRNKREHLTTLTPKGLRLITVAMDILAKFESPIFETFSDKQFEQFVELLDGLHRKVCSSKN